MSWRLWSFLALVALALSLSAQERIPSVMAGGVTYSNVTVISRTATHISFKHAHGFASVRLDSLSSDNQTKVGYTPPPPPKSLTDYTTDFSQDLARLLNDPRLTTLEHQIRTEVERVIKEDDKVLLHSAAGGAACIYILFCLAVVKICRKTTVRPGLWAWLPGFQFIALFKAAGMSPWTYLLLYVPVVNVVVMIMWCFKICRMRQKPAALGFLLLVIPINILVFFYLAFSSQKNAPTVRRGPEKLRLSFQH